VIPETYCASCADAGALELDELDALEEDDPPADEDCVNPGDVAPCTYGAGPEGTAGVEETDADAGTVGGVLAGEVTDGGVTATGAAGSFGKNVRYKIGGVGRLIGPMLRIGLIAAIIVVAVFVFWMLLPHKLKPNLCRNIPCSFPKKA
jgi:hypothetical protein